MIYRSGKRNNPYEIAEDEEIKKKWKNRVNAAAEVLNSGCAGLNGEEPLA